MYMPENFRREASRQILIDRTPGPDYETVPGQICLAAMRRARQEVGYDGDTCYFAAENSRELCLGSVSVDGTSVTESCANDGACLRTQEINIGLATFQETSNPLDSK
jgi:hypothetical protein